MTNHQTFSIQGMTCQSCAAKIQDTLLSNPLITSAVVTKSTDTATIESSQNIAIEVLQDQLQNLDPKYSISVSPNNGQVSTLKSTQAKKSWLATYQPILTVFSYILGTTLIIQLVSEGFDAMEWMRHFMAGFFLVFSFFKMMDLRGFSESYLMYDVIAKRWSGWGYVYAFVELGLGVAYLVSTNLAITAIITLIIMTISTVGVLQSVLQNRQIQCACLGSVFDLPMSTVTIIENGLMIGMSVFMIYFYL